jgi:hypothetical protein
MKNIIDVTEQRRLNVSSESSTGLHLMQFTARRAMGNGAVDLRSEQEIVHGSLIF